MIILDLSHPICLFLFAYTMHTPLFRFYVLYLYCSTPVRWLVLIVVSFNYFCFSAKNHLGAFFSLDAPNQDFFFPFAHTKSSFFKRLNDNPGSFSPHRTSFIQLFFSDVSGKRAKVKFLACVTRARLESRHKNIRCISHCFALQFSLARS